MKESTELEIIYLLNIFATVPSLIGSGLVSYFSFQKRSLNISIKLILALSISDFFYSAVNIISAFDTTPEGLVCKIEGLYRLFFRNFSMCIAIAIAILHHQIITASQSLNRKRFLIGSIFFGLLVSTIISAR